MNELLEVLKSLVQPFFNGIGQILTGGFGIATSVIAWIQLAIQFWLAYNHTNGIVGVLLFGVGLALVQAAAALLAFLTVNGNAYELPGKQLPLRTVFSVTAFWGVLIGGIGSALVVFWIWLIFGTYDEFTLICYSALAAGLQNLAVVGALHWDLLRNAKKTS